MDLWTYERRCWAEGYDTLCGVDEAGAGPLAGPVYAAAVILPRELEIPGLNDSKKLTEKRRESLYQVITAQAGAWSVARVEAAEIDNTDILSARLRAMQAAIDGLSLKPAFALIDGNRDRGKSAAITVPHMLIVKGDGKSASIAAASILAKVSRDRYMAGELHTQYPQYGFARHKGYGTKLHYEMLEKYGPCPEHRMTFLKPKSAKPTPRRQAGDRGEEAAERYLLSERDASILDRQWHCRYGEIDLVARERDGTVAFVEVKLRGESMVGLPREAVDFRKRERLRKTAAAWMAAHECAAPARFDVAEVYEERDGGRRVEYLEDAFQ